MRLSWHDMVASPHARPVWMISSEPRSTASAYNWTLRRNSWCAMNALPSIAKAWGLAATAPGADAAGATISMPNATVEAAAAKLSVLE
eukprot:7380213-Prymnesium_polylepis.1